MTDFAAIPPHRPLSVAEVLLVFVLRTEAEVDFDAQLEQDRFLDWSRLARRGTWRADLASQIELHGAGQALGWIGLHAADSDDQEFWREAVERLRTVVPS